MMATFAPVFATLPVAIGFGAVVGGLLFSQFLALYITPTFHVSMARLEAALKCWRARFA